MWCYLGGVKGKTSWCHGVGVETKKHSAYGVTCDQAIYLRRRPFIFFPVFGTPDETLALVVDILLQNWMYKIILGSVVVLTKELVIQLNSRFRILSIWKSPFPIMLSFRLCFSSFNYIFCGKKIESICSWNSNCMRRKMIKGCQVTSHLLFIIIDRFVQWTFWCKVEI